MKLLLDTHILLWIALDMLPKSAEGHILDESNALFFSPASIWEIVIKRGLDRDDFNDLNIDPQILCNALLDNGYEQINITARHTLLTGSLQMFHKDPFDRILLAQSIAEGLTLMTADKIMTKYPASVLYIKQ